MIKMKKILVTLIIALLLVVALMGGVYALSDTKGKSFQGTFIKDSESIGYLYKTG